MLSETHIYREIHEQPVVLEKLITRRQKAITELAQAIQRRGITHVMIAARGTSDNAGRYAKYVLGAMNGLIVSLAAPSLFTIYKQPPRFHSTLALGISQSGMSPDIVAVLEEAKKQGALTGAITNAPDSALAAQADIVIALDAGEERAVAATKTYTAELAAIALLSAALSGDGAAMADLERVPTAVESIFSQEVSIAQAASHFRTIQHAIVVGRGYNYATAFELALKLKELTYTVVEPYSSADFLHGPLAMIEPGFPVIAIAPSGLMLDEMQHLIRAIKDHQARVIGISDDEKSLNAISYPIHVPQLAAEWLSPITMIVPGQLLALHLAHLRGYDVDAPRSIHKVTRTT